MARSSFRRGALGALAALLVAPALPALAQKTVAFRYGHMNPPNSAAGLQAQMLADLIAKNTGGQGKVTVAAACVGTPGSCTCTYTGPIANP